MTAGGIRPRRLLWRSSRGGQRLLVLVTHLLELPKQARRMVAVQCAPSMRFDSLSYLSTHALTAVHRSLV